MSQAQKMHSIHCILCTSTIFKSTNSPFRALNVSGLEVSYLKIKSHILYCSMNLMVFCELIFKLYIFFHWPTVE